MYETLHFFYPLGRCANAYGIHTASRRIHSAVTGVYPAIFNFLRRAKPRTKIHHILRPTHRPFKTYIQTDIIMPSHRRTSVVVIIHFYCKLCLANQNLIKELFLFKLISKCISIIRRLLVLCGFNRTIFHIYWVQLWMLSRESMVYCRQSVIMDGSCITLISCDMCAMVWVARKTVFIHTSCIMYIASYSFELFAFLMRGEHIQESTDTCMLRI